MKDSQNITITLLLATALIMTVALLVTYTTNENVAYADTPVKQGDYVFGSGAVSGSTDNIYLIDIATRRLNVYRPNINTSAIDLIDTVDLRRAFASGG